jgi:hypothetical protein
MRRLIVCNAMSLDGYDTGTGGSQDEAVRQFRRWAWGMRAIAAVLIVAFWDIVAKPGQ